MYKVGVFPGKFLPPHRGHINSIINAATQVEKLYVVVSSNENYMRDVCDENNLRYMSLNLRARWMAKELSGFDHIKIVTIDETHIPQYPHGTVQWCELLSSSIPEKFDVIFGGEEEYRHTYMQSFPEDVDYVVYDKNRQRWPISATKIRKNPLKHWDYILGSARPHFAKRVLITGTESVGKTTLTKYLGKIYHTSWSEEYGRYYSGEKMGGNDSLFELRDFVIIADKQKEYDEEALRTSNKVVFFDTDAVVTQYYSEIYLGEKNENIISNDFSDPNFYDIVLFLSPEVKWIDDGQRFKSNQNERKKLHRYLKKLYIENGFSEKIVDIRGNSYYDRLDQILEIVDSLIDIGEKECLKSFQKK